MTRIYEFHFESVDEDSFIYVYEHMLSEDIKRDLFQEDHKLSRVHIYIRRKIKNIYRRLTNRERQNNNSILSREDYFYHLDASWRYV